MCPAFAGVRCWQWRSDGKSTADKGAHTDLLNCIKIVVTARALYNWYLFKSEQDRVLCARLYILLCLLRCKWNVDSKVGYMLGFKLHQPVPSATSSLSAAYFRTQTEELGIRLSLPRVTETRASDDDCCSGWCWCQWLWWFKKCRWWGALWRSG